MIKKFAITLFILTAFWGPSFGFAQDVARPLDAPTINQEYERAIRLRGIDNDVLYFDPSAPAPRFDTRERPPPEPQNVEPVIFGSSNMAVILFSCVFLFAVAFLFFKYSGASSPVLRSDVKNPKRSTKKSKQRNAAYEVDNTAFDQIVENPDRQQALIGLAQLLIYKAVTANELLLQRSWTARDVLMRMPKNSTYLPELRELVLKGELVHFGEREVTEEEFADFAARAKPLMKALSS